MLIDLPSEYRKICIVSLMVAMWTIVLPFAPLVGYTALLVRFKFNFVRLTKFSRRPIPKKPLR